MPSHLLFYLKRIRKHFSLKKKLFFVHLYSLVYCENKIMQFEKGFYNNNNNSFCYTRIFFSSTLFSILFYILRLLKILICYYCGKSLANDIHMALECRKKSQIRYKNHTVKWFCYCFPRFECNTLPWSVSYNCH